ncbi:MAG: endonuclease/exonuclease/phosphatase family protein [Alphaproteobacteria bacterium]
MRIVTWNIERKAPESAASRTMLARIATLEPDIVCLTEAHEGSPASFGGHALFDVGASWGGEAPSERKVALVSRTPWRDVTPLPDLSALGGAISATTDTDLGPVRVVGVCTPHHFASPGGALPRPPLWSMHIAYFKALGAALEGMGREQPTVIVGDFNQFLPLVWGSWDAHHALTHALRHFSVVTQGAIEPVGEPTIDHVAIGKQLRAAKVESLDRFNESGQALSDHFGVAVDLESGGVQIFD